MSDCAGRIRCWKHRYFHWSAHGFRSCGDGLISLQASKTLFGPTLFGSGQETGSTVRETTHFLHGTWLIKYEGVLSPALRNYILSHTSRVYERSYQPKHVRENVQAIFDQGCQSDGQEEIFQLLRNSSLRCDELAPINASEQEIANWKETRKDLRDLLSSNDYNKHAKIRSIIRALSQSHVQNKRRQYFKQANERRSLGQTTSDLVSTSNGSGTPKDQSPLTEAVSAFLEINSTDQIPEATSTSTYIELVIAFLGESRAIGGAQVPTCFLCSLTFKEWTEVWKHTATAHPHGKSWPFSCPECARLGYEESLTQIDNHCEWSAHVHEKHAPRDQEPPRCFLGCGLFYSQSTLTRHINKYHDGFRTIPASFPCPECRRLGEKDYVIKDHLDLRQHVNSRHNPKLVPKTLTATTKHVCLLCWDQVFPTKGGLSQHTTKVHVHGKRTFDAAFPCPECRRDSGEDYIVDSLIDWCRHVEDHHGSHNAPNPAQSSQIRCLLCDGYFYNEKEHFNATHLNRGLFNNPFSCPECLRQGGDSDTSETIDGPEHWVIHCAASHGRITPVVTPSNQKTPTRCLICNMFFMAGASHFTRKHVSNGLFSNPFQCPECVRTGKIDSETIESREQWLIHCAAIHKDMSAATLSTTEGIKNKNSQIMSVRNPSSGIDTEEEHSAGAKKRAWTEEVGVFEREPKVRRVAQV